jgi:glycosyltransferase involved in cell wall biosynthesis
MTGFVQGQELQELYSNAYLFVLPSDIEGMSMGLLEALSYGNTCLVSDIPENTEVISKNSYSFKKGNVDDLAEKLKEIINKNLQTHTGTTIYHTWQEVTKQTLEVYRK